MDATEGLEELIADLEEIAEKARNIDPVNREIASRLLGAAKEAFDERSSPFGIPWQPLSPATLAIRKEPPSGRLQASIGLSFASDGSGATLGASAPYGAFQGQGIPNNRLFGKGRVHPVPARSWLPFDEAGNIPEEIESGLSDLIFGHLFEDNE